MNDGYGRRLQGADLGRLSDLATAVLGIALLTFLVSWVVLLQWVEPTNDLLGITVFEFLGTGLLLGGVSVICFGVGSRFGVGSTTPDHTAGTPTAGVVALLYLAVVGLFGSQTLGWEGFGWVAIEGMPLVVPVGWLLIAIPVGAGIGWGTAIVREDLGSTLPLGALVALGGAVIASGTIGLGWQWNLHDVSAVIHGEQAVPFLAVFLALLLVWMAAKAREGFGAQGRQQAAFMLVGVTAFAMLAVLALLVMFITVRGAGRAFQGFYVGLEGIRWPFVTTGSTFGADTPDGVYPAIVGTVWLVIGSMSFAVPLGIGAAVFLTEYAEQGRFTAVVEVATNALWSTPSIVFGLFGYALLVPRIQNRNTLLSGMLVLGFMLLPLVIITARESLKAVPDEYRDASAALGVSEWETIRSVVLPAAMPGVVTGIILGVGRIAGETAPLILVMAGGLNQDSGTLLSPDLLEGGQALPYKLYAIITAGVDASSEFGWATAFILLVVVLGFYAIGIGSRIYFRRKLNE
ncbi:MAG: phosphate ABC transporter permease PstA [Halobacteriaceae archaeon]